ncbi:MAG: DNA starvation/stationary phase protection protein [Gammaproteobacteria bacterium RIFCSPHIGHO2_12_FULL_35_23]|nr:MAG: DNA starvation/stationary phase protection protein [Gammaproteobacteria bacterium RIFCSPHIGHO2_12_FULL_35_23]
MSQESLIKAFKVVLADTYTLYLKTQNYHWHVKGPSFQSLHLLFESQYQSLAEAVDTIAERILTMGGSAPATFKEFLTLTTLKEGETSLSADRMVRELVVDQETILKSLATALAAAQKTGDEGSIALLGERIAEHEKNRWMLASSI